MTDWGSSLRRDYFKLMLVDPFSLQNLREIEFDAASSSISWDYYGTNKVDANLKIVNSSLEYGSLDGLLRVMQRIDIGDASWSGELATMFVDTADLTAKYKLESQTTKCYGTFYRHTQDTLVSDFNRKAGKNVVDSIRYLVEVDGGHLLVGDDVPTGKTFGKNIHFDMNTNKMKVIDTIAGWIGCQMDTSPGGYVRIEKYLSPGCKPVSYSFVSGENCTYLPGVDRKDGSADVCNRVVAYWSGTDKTLRSVADLDDGEKFSYERCGRHRTYVLQVSDECTQSELDDKAKTYLQEHKGAPTTFNVQHVGIPGLFPGMMVDYTNESDFINRVHARCIIANMSMQSLTPGAVCQTKLKVI